MVGFATHYFFNGQGHTQVFSICGGRTLIGILFFDNFPETPLFYRTAFTGFGFHAINEFFGLFFC